MERPTFVICSSLRFCKCALAFALLLALTLVNARTTLLVPLDKEASWRDMAFLAAIPAGCAANTRSPSVIALERSCTVGPEISDYLSRYRPDRVLLLSDGGQSVETIAGVAKTIVVDSPTLAAIALSRTFWKTSKTAVMCQDDDYDSALLASSIASLLKAPLLFVSGSSKAEENELKRLGAKELVWIGSNPPSSLRFTSKLDGPIQAMEWVRKRGVRVAYLAAVNPLDRDNYVTRKLSLVGAELAAGRQGMVAPLRFAVQWKQPFESSVMKGACPVGVPASVASAKSGSIEIGQSKVPFILTGDLKEENLKLSIDTKGNGQFTGPYVSGDQIDLGGKRWAISLGTRTKFGKTDVHLTWPTAERLCQELRTYYRALGAPPTNLCLVGFPDALPQAIIGHGGIVEEQASDLPFSFATEGKFAEIGVGRVIAENISFGTLYASRALTYSDLASPEWSSKACGAAWESMYRPLFENYGYSAPFVHKSENNPWKTPPTNGTGGTKSSSFGKDSPLANCSLLAHADHSWWRGLGSTIEWDSEVLMAPTVVESGGCGTACLDREPDNRTVVARLMRLGAAAFAGASREQPAEAQPVRDGFWSGVLAGESLGQAHLRGLNCGILTVLDTKEGDGGAYRYSTNIRMLFGDPALVVKTPSKPKSMPARTVVNGKKVSVFAPEKWFVVKFVVPADWKQWYGKDLYGLRSAGSYAMSDWCEQGYDLEQYLVSAQFVSRKQVSEINQVQNVPTPLGWKGTWYEQANANGTYTYRFAVRMVDFDQINGKILNQVDRLDYLLTYK